MGTSKLDFKASGLTPKTSEMVTNAAAEALVQCGELGKFRVVHSASSSSSIVRPGAALVTITILLEEMPGEEGS